MNRLTRSTIASVVFLLFLALGGSAQTGRKPGSSLYPFRVVLPSHLGEITQAYFPTHRIPNLKPDFILIQNVHSNIFVQFAISSILTELKAQDLLPEHIAVEGAVGPVDIQGMQRNPDARERRAIANYLVSQGEMTGAAHFAASEGKGDLYGVESPGLYRSAVYIFRRSYYSRTRLSKQLDRLEAALTLIKMEPGEATCASILEQDIQVIRHLVDQQLVPTEIHQVMNQAVFAVDHLKHILSGQKDEDLLEPVSAAVDFYALALLRDKGLLKHALELRRQHHQKTTVLIAGGFHTAGMTKRLEEGGYSYVVITPQVGAYNEADEHLYVQRLLGYPLPSGPTPGLDAPLLKFQNERVPAYRMNTAETWFLANTLRRKLPKLQISMPPVRDIFTALDSPLQPSVKVTLIKQRAEMLSSAEQMALNH